MNSEEQNALIDTLAESSASDFYRTYWGDQRPVPTLTAALLANTPSTRRAYRSDQGVVRSITTTDGTTFFVKRSFAAIAQDKLNVPAGSRVLVLARSNEEALDHSLWCYEHGSIPYHGDAGNIEVAAFCAEHFRTNVLISDQAMFDTLTSTSLMPSTVEHVMIADRTHTPLATDRTLARVLYLPETGCLGNVTETKGVFRVSSADGVALTVEDHQLIATKAGEVMPFVRYETNIAAHMDGDVIVLR